MERTPHEEAGFTTVLPEKLPRVGMSVLELMTAAVGICRRGSWQ